jgi:hypothetical protein
MAGCECGKIAHVRSAKIRPIIGAMIKKCLFIKIGLFCSLVNNLIASANGWGSPMIDTLLGPFRSWK